MTISTLADGVLVGLSTDTKTAMPNGYMFRETDTGDLLVSDGTYWWLCGWPSPLSTRRIGLLSPGPNFTNGGLGLCSTLSTATGLGTQAIVFGDSVNGRYYTGVTGTVTGNRGGYRQANVAAKRWNNPKIRFRFKLVTTTLQNFWLGFNGGPTELAGADPLNALAGVIFGINTGVATNWVVMHNTNVGATTIDNTGIAYDANIHTVNIVGDNANARWSWNLDGGAYTHLTNASNIPPNNFDLGFIAEIETQDSGISKSFQLYSMSIQTEN